MLLMRTVFEVMRTHSPIEERGTYLTVDDVVDLPTETTEEILDKYNMAFTSTEISEIKLALEQLRAQPSDEPFVELQEKDNLVKLLHIVHEYTTLTISYLSPDTQGSDQSKTQVHGDLPSVLMTKQWKKFFLELLDHYSQNKDKARFLIMFSLLKKLNVSTQHLQENARYMGSRLTEIIHQLSKKE
ncbi:hypothetical protein NADFUDRAFT_81654 [Nadsonia fulvescens var. elongata DSM 6958]|uniref:Uncharacterized protein n=1 Tax=Nadsonia fulvescens var. elongata DSM 6958 TaxID=857566 RepID=A0A1E3PP04_9ASCO|nr:hypothetical protein NADFUDRAFT_81654 [Nadsonia fulvescens var. elongata DSM 6958]